MSSLPELELSQLLAGSSAAQGVERQQQEEDLRAPAAPLVAAAAAAPDTTDMSAPVPSQLAASSAGEGAEHQEQEEGLGSPAAAAAAPLVAAPDTAGMGAPKPSQLAGSSAGVVVERQDQEADDGVPLPAAAAAVPPVPVPAAAEIQVVGGAAAVPPVPAAGEVQAVDREVLEADVIVMTVENNLFARVFIVPNPMAARYVYAVLFAWMAIVAWFMRDIELSRFDHSGCDGARDCIAADGVLRVSMALAIFFFIMFLSTVNTMKRYECRNYWHCRWWTPKAGLFVIGCGFALYAPSSLIELYGRVAHLGAGLFLIIQFFSVTSFIMWVNKWCRVKSNRERWAQMTYGLLPLSAAPVVLYLGSFLGLGFMYYWYAPYSEPTTFIYISVAMSVICLMSLISCVRKVSGGYLAPGLMMAYVVLMCWTVIRSEPHMETSNKNTKHTADWQSILSLAIAAVVIIVSTYTVGIDTKCIKFSYTPELGDDIPYGYGFFHLVFASGAMYIGMLFIGWNAHKKMEKWAVDFGWASTRVRATSGLEVAICYILMLVSQKLWDFMLSLTSNSTPSDNVAGPAGAAVMPPVVA